MFAYFGFLRPWTFALSLATASSVFSLSDAAETGGYNCTENDCPLPFKDGYMSFAQMNWYLSALQNVTNKVELVTSRYSSSGNKFLMVIVRPYRRAHVRNAVKKERDAFWLETGFEANDFLNVQVALHFIHNLVWNCQANCGMDYYIIPLMNPDGYEYARTTDPNWKKDRVKHSNGCYGIDMNRNFPPASRFNLYGSSNPCSEDFRGHFAASAVEVSTLLGMKYSVSNMKMAVTVPGYGKQIMYPEAYKPGNISKIDKYIDIASHFVSSVKQMDGPEYATGSFADLVGPQSGTSMDYWYYFDLAPYVFTINLEAPEGDSPPTDIDIRSKKIYEGIMGMITRMCNIENYAQK